jgi:hypothetical protein
MRQTISGLVAAIAVVIASAAPAMACGGLFGSCSPCGGYVSPCAQAYVPAPVYAGCITGCGGWVHERLPDPVQQYYYVNQGPTYTGPGNWAPYPVYREGGVGPVVYRYHAHHWHPHSYGYGYAHRYYGYHHYGYHGRVLSRYY